MKKAVSLLLCVLLVFSCATVGFAAQESERTPVIVVSGMGAFPTVNNETGESVFPPSAQTIIKTVLGAAGPLAASVALNKWDILGKYGAKPLHDLFEGMKCDENGNPVYNTSAKTFPGSADQYDELKGGESLEVAALRACADEIGWKNTYYFYYDWRMSALDIADDLELGILENGLEVGEAIVEFMVAERRDIIACRVHQFDRGLALRVADIGRALDVVARVHEDDVGALFCVVLFQCCYLCVQADRTVHVVGVQDDGLPGQLSVRGQRAGHQTEHQNNGQKKCYEFFHSILLYFLPPDGGKITKAVPHIRLSYYYTAFPWYRLSAVFRKKNGIFRDYAQKK